MDGVGSKVKVIESLTVLLSDSENKYEVGLLHNGRYVANIEDNGCEWENGIDFIYRVYDERGDQIATIENCPVIVEYKVPLKE